MIDPHIDYLFSLIMQISHLSREYLNHYARTKGLTMPQLVTLKYITEEGRPTMKQTADFLCITTASATSIIDGLVRSGEVRRMPDKKDRRIIRLEITAKGQKNLRRNLKEVENYIKMMLKTIPEKDHQNLIKILENILKFYNQNQ